MHKAPASGDRVPPKAKRGKRNPCILVAAPAIEQRVPRENVGVRAMPATGATVAGIMEKLPKEPWLIELTPLPEGFSVQQRAGSP